MKVSLSVAIATPILTFLVALIVLSNLLLPPALDTPPQLEGPTIRVVYETPPTYSTSDVVFFSIMTAAVSEVAVVLVEAVKKKHE